MPQETNQPRRMPKLQPQTGVLFQENGDVILRIAALPDAEVTALVGNDGSTAVKLNMAFDPASRIYTATLPAGTMAGPQKVVFTVNGVTTLNLAAPMWYYANQLANYIELPDPETDALIEARRDVAHGAVTQEFFWSEAFGEFVTVPVYTPPGYEQGGEYPVLYLFHEVAENKTAWTAASRLNFVLDNLIAEKKCVPFIVVEVDSTIRLDYKDYPDWFENYGPIEKFLSEDCPQFMESRYRVSRSKWKRAIGGIGLGAIQAAYIGLRHTDLFGSIGVFTAFWPSVGFHEEGKDDPFYTSLKWLGEHPDELDVFFRAEGELDPHFKFITHENDKLAELKVDKLPGYVFKTYHQTHNWGSYRRAMRDMAPMLFRK